MSEWIVTKEATCEEEGNKHRECNRCGHTEEEVIVSQGHKYEVVTVDPNCAENGYTLYTCFCGTTYADDILDALNHDMGDWVVTDATCTEDGSKTRACKRKGCDHTETDVLAALGHDLTDQTTAPSCTESGSKVSSCSRCDFIETEIIEAMGHSHEAAVTEPRCEKGGYTTHTCHCGDVYTDAETSALGHSVSYAVEIAPAVEAEGSISGACERCGEVFARTLPKLNEDDYEYEVVTEPTEEKEGLGRYTYTDAEHGTYSFDVKLDKLATILLGDVNDDGKVTVLDLMRLANFFAGKGVEIKEVNTDVNDDGKITVLDLMRLANYFAGKAGLG